MNKVQFLHRLRELLTGIPASEAQDAVKYYEDYFSDAGEENEARVIEELGSPEKVAETIRKDLGYEGAFYDQTYQNNGWQEQTYQNNTQGAQNYQYSGTEYTQSEQPKKRNVIGWILLGLSLPFWIVLIPILFAILCTIGSIIFALIAAMFSIAVAVVAMLITAGCIIGFGVVKLFVSPVGGMMLLGAAMIIIALAIVMALGLRWFFATAVPAMCRGVASACRCVWNKVRGKARDAV